ncbi:MAG: DNA replication/repair protein RecF, partial [Coriobacteriia bacterium]|nr:DNA replication/repair protein RecF [Coriobacteriia bacterium]
PRESLEIVYQPSWGERLEKEDKDTVLEVLQDTLQSKQEDELIRRLTLFGPQKDDFIFLLNGKNARTYGSQGQQRSLTLALKIAEVKVIQEFYGYNPILLLDDVMSELDDFRRHELLEFISSDIQTIITTTHLSYFPEYILNKAKVIEF